MIRETDNIERAIAEQKRHANLDVPTPFPLCWNKNNVKIEEEINSLKHKAQSKNND